ncbi:hypothetical protein F4774DRAFT_395595 [Daldinia eschscholtzii]|nr:hypothetical protein F4774DRAFT_395595 [Daldinia eschscholtzii]
MGKHSSRQLIKNLEERHDYVRERVQKFAEIANNDSIRLPIWCFFETRKTRIIRRALPSWIPNTLLHSSILVTESSACLHGFTRVALGRTHVLMNKFEGKDCSDFKQVKGAVQFLLNEKTNTLRRREKNETTQNSTEPDMHKKKIKVLKSLYFQSMNQRKNDSRNSYAGTFKWIFRTNNTADKPNRTWCDFEDWLESDDTMYWISGKAGSGKTTLMKYLIENNLTRKALTIWAMRTKRAGSPVIFCHLFWKAGSDPLQRNVKGCLCSILYQAIHFDVVPLDSTLATHRSLLAKESINDWSSQELENLCFGTLRSCPSPVCIFLDGLDEICLQDRPALMELVEKLRNLSGIKICVASRPERDLDSTFSKYPHLRLQDLTYQDMKIYASDKMEPYVSSGQISKYFRSDITKVLVKKAEGVFLWLHLASDSLVRGLKNNDSEKILNKRLEEMPRDLGRLYEDMWNRVNEDTTQYRETTARYLNLAIVSQGMKRPFSSLSLFQLMTTNDEVQHRFEKKDTMDVAFLIRQCEKTLSEIQTQCVGLLEVVWIPSFQFDDVWDPNYKPILAYQEKSVAFTHRTAYDFLTDTKPGHDILACDSSPQHELPIKLIRGGLIVTKFIDLNTSKYHINDVIDALSRLPSTVPRLEIEKTLIDTWHLYDDGYYGKSDEYKPHFLEIAAYFGLVDCIKSSIEKSKNPSSLARDILQYISTFGGNYEGLEFQDYLGRLEPSWDLLSRLGADPNIKGICGANRYCHSYPSEGQPMRTVLFHSSIACLVHALVSPNLKLKNNKAAYRQLQRIMKYKPDLQEHLPLLVSLNGSYTEVDFPFSRDYIDRIRPCIVLDMDLASLIEACSKRVFRRGLQLSEDEMLYQPPGEPSRGASSRIALIDVCSAKHFRREKPAPRHICCPERETKRLFDLLIQIVHGNDPKDLAHEAYQEYSKIIENAGRGSIEYEEIDCTAEEYLAERKIGYRFVDGNGAVIE